jgi:hypothetical protein
MTVFSPQSYVIKLMKKKGCVFSKLVAQHNKVKEGGVGKPILLQAVPRCKTHSSFFNYLKPRKSRKKSVTDGCW